MVGEPESPDDVSTMMEELWGPRGEGPIGDVAGRRDRTPAADEPRARAHTGAQAEDEQVHPSVAGLVEMVEARQAETIDRARSELEGLRADVDAALAHLATQLAGARHDAVAAADARVAGAETRLLSRLDEIAAGVAQVAQGSTVGHDVLTRLEAVERETAKRWAAIEGRVGPELQSLAQAVEDRKAESEGAPATSPAPELLDPAALRSDVQADIARMLQAERAELERSIAEAVGQVAERLEAEQSELRAALDAQAEQLQVALDREGARVGGVVDRADRAATDGDLTRAQEDMRGRLDQMGARLEQLQAAVDTERVQRVAEAADGGRLEALEGEISDLGEYHAALDAGLGALRAEIAELRDTMRKMASDQADLLDRAEAPAQVASPGDAGQGRARRSGRKGETETRLASVLSAAEGLAGEHQQLKADMARLEQEVRALATTAPALGPLRSDVRLLREQLAVQNEALVALRAVVEATPKKAPARAPAATRAPRPKKD